MMKNRKCLTMGKVHRAVVRNELAFGGQKTCGSCLAVCYIDHGERGKVHDERQGCVATNKRDVNVA